MGHTQPVVEWEKILFNCSPIDCWEN